MKRNPKDRTPVSAAATCWPTISLATPERGGTRLSTWLVCASILFTLASAPSRAAEYEFSEGPYVDQWGDPTPWSGNRGFLDVYCVRFPDAAAVQSTAEGLLKGGGISFFRAVYDSNVHAFVVTSTIPSGQEPVAFDDWLRSEQNTAAGFKAASAAQRYRVRTKQSAWGPVIALQTRGVTEHAPEGPFPLTRRLYEDDKSYTRSSHRMFVKGSNRFEVALFGAPEDGEAKSLPALEARLEVLADHLTDSLQECTTAATAAVPRLPRPDQ